MIEQLKQNVIVQNAYVVDDLNAAIDAWAGLMGAGPFFVINDVDFKAVYRGADSNVNLSIAMCQVGSLNIELIQQNDDAPSVYRDIYQKGESGFHHICVFADELDHELKGYNALGFDTAFESHDAESGLKFAYVDTFSALGCMIEIVEDGPVIRSIYQKVRDGAEGWDGRDLKRPLY